jgi:uncharacterized repeat protein (TIGR01451 family)
MLFLKNVNKKMNLYRNIYSIIPYTIFLFLSIYTGQTAIAQCSPPSADNCKDANVLCSLDELNGYSCSNPVYSNPTGCTPLCPGGGASHNTAWWAFVTEGGNVTITFNIGNCSITGGGIQYGIWGDCDCKESIACNNDVHGPGTYTINANFIACKTYYLFVDGFLGDVCDFTIRTNGGSSPQLRPLGKINNDPDRKFQVCQGICNEKFVIEEQNVNCIPIYEWMLDGKIIGGNDNETSLDFPDEGDFQLCVTAYIGNPNSGSICDQEGPECITIRVGNVPEGIGPSRNICATELPYKWGSVKIYNDGLARSTFRDSNCCKIDSIVDFHIIYNDSLGCQNTNYAKGIVFFDQNKNGFFDNQEIKLNDYIISSAPGSFATFSNQNGYTILLERNAINTIKASVPNPAIATVVPSDYQINVGNVYGQIPGQYDFAIQEKDLLDLEIQINSTVARPGRTSVVTLQVNNVGNIAATQSVITLQFPIGWNVIRTNPMHTNILGGNLLRWDYTNTINIKGSKSFRIELAPPTTAKQGTSFELIAEVDATNDVNPINDIAVWNNKILASYDPNDKLVNKSNYYSISDQNKELIYTIRFQNTGTDTAFDVTIRDTLSKAIDATSIRVVNASHPYQLRMKKLGYLEVYFKNIFLPDSSVNELASHGFVQFAIRPNATNEPFTLRNKASIYFDYNTPVLTNSISTYVGLVATHNINKQALLKTTPNPFSDQIIVVYESLKKYSNYHLQIRNIHGIMTHDIQVQQKGKVEINTKLIPSGVYELMFISDDQILLSNKIVKQ